MNERRITGLWLHTIIFSPSVKFYQVSYLMTMIPNRSWCYIPVGPQGHVGLHSNTFVGFMVDTIQHAFPKKPFELTNSIIRFWSTMRNGLLYIFHREQLVCVCPCLGQRRSWARFHLVIFLEYIFTIASRSLIKYCPKLILSFFKHLWHFETYNPVYCITDNLGN